MKIPCPYCSQQLNLPDRFAGKSTKCPACQKTFEVPAFPEGSPEAIAAAAAAAAAKPPPEIVAAMSNSDDLGLHSMTEEKKRDGPPALTVCPACNAPWKKDAVECGKCRYNVFVGGKARRGAKRSFKLNIDSQKVFLYAAIAGAVYGGYWLYSGGWTKVSRTVNQTFDDAARGHPSEDDDSLMKRRDSAKTTEDKK